MRGKGQLGRATVTPWLLLLPSFILLVAFTLFPIVKTIYLSFFQSDLGVPKPIFVGLQNYQRLAEDKIFWKSFFNTIIFAVITVPVSITFGLIMAMLVNRTFRGDGLVKTFFFYPVILPLIAVANIWMYLYSPSGLLTACLKLLHIANESVLSNSQTVLPALMVMIIWKEAGFFMIFYLAALKNLPEEIYEAARLDGIRGWYRFSNVTFPLLMPTTLFCLVMATADAFKLIDHLIVMTQGGPDNSSNMLLYYIYEIAFQYIDQGKAATVTIVVLVILTILFCIQFFGIDRRVHYN
ncbi:MAG: sugar ABC transporter permease [Sporolactobacillus sp.]|jgi:sn-glycerol 3-phosphate transport system permease protein|nr:sugar ABC transporter permease [Sporolactobacillus sp.]MCI1882183.1 sugar ABC transporter permease [Sporolactobacillus sp.]